MKILHVFDDANGRFMKAIDLSRNCEVSETEADEFLIRADILLVNTPNGISLYFWTHDPSGSYDCVFLSKNIGQQEAIELATEHWKKFSINEPMIYIATEEAE